MKDQPKQTLFFVAFILSGFSAMMAQIIILRELMIVFSGNELTVGMTIAVWLICTAVGSSLISLLIKRIVRIQLLFFGLELLLSILFLVTFFMIRISPVMWNLTRGEMTNLSHVFIIPLLVLLPFCLFNGMIYAIGTSLLSRVRKLQGVAASKVYMLEAIGSGIATLIGSIFLIRALETSQLVIVVSVSFILTSSLWCFYYLHGWASRIITWSVYVVTLSVCTFLIVTRTDARTIHKFWGDLHLIHAETTIYGHIAITKLEDSISFYESGSLMFTYPDLYYAEESVHFALLQHPEPESVLLIGGGMGGSIEQIVKHPAIARIDYVELDPAIIRLGRTFLPTTVTRFLDDPKVHIWNMDGRVYLKDCQQKYDVIIVNLPDPVTTQINRFYSIDFFKSVNRILNQGGILSYSVVSSENYISEELAKFLGCLYHTTHEVFSDILLIPGDSNYFIATNERNYLSSDPQILIDRMNARALNTTFIREYYLPYRMSSERMHYLIDRIDDPQYRISNSDFKPIASFLNLIVWSTYFDGFIKSVFSTLLRYDSILLLIIPMILSLLLIGWNLCLKNTRSKLRNTLLLSIAMIGFSAMSFEIIIMLGFQVIYGNMYYQLSLILATFMVGLSLGSYISIKINTDAGSSVRAFIVVQSLIILFPITLLIMLKLASTVTFGYLIMQVVFLIVILVSGCLCGFQFPTATVIYRGVTEKVERTAGVLYAWDLFGSCLGALIISAIIIPALGIMKSCVALAIINAIVFLGMVISYRKWNC